MNEPAGRLVARPEDDTTRGDVCVIVRMFNEASTLPAVLAELRSAFGDVVCVDDGSSDGSAAIASRAGARVVQHPKNLGGGAALQTGLTFALRASNAQYFVTFDADGQHHVPDAVRMVKHARTSGLDVLLGSRFLGEGVANIPMARRIILRGGVIFTRLISRMSITDTHNGLRVLSREAVGKIHLRLPGMAYASELLDQISTLNLSYAEFPVSVRYTEYSMAKGQRNLNAVNIAFDVLAFKMRAVD